jgi:GDP-4-dehydro-6-deoxy-D-mannose reductase
VSETILVTGAAGFVGGHLLRLLNSRHPSSTRVAWRRPAQEGAADTRPELETGKRGARWSEIDLLDSRAVSDAIADIKPTQVYHCAGVASVGDSWSNNYATLRTNVLGTEYLLTALRDHAPEARTLIPGSALVYKPSDTVIDETGALGPVSPYGLSKLAQEMVGLAAARNDGLAVLVTRSFTHVGPGQSLAFAASSFAHQIARIEEGLAEPVLSVGNLDSKRDLTDVRDTVRAYHRLITHCCSVTRHAYTRRLAGSRRFLSNPPWRACSTTGARPSRASGNRDAAATNRDLRECNRASIMTICTCVDFQRVV